MSNALFTELDYQLWSILQYSKFSTFLFYKVFNKWSKCIFSLTLSFYKLDYDYLFAIIPNKMHHMRHTVQFDCTWIESANYKFTVKYTAHFVLLVIWKYGYKTINKAPTQGWQNATIQFLNNFLVCNK